MGAHLFAERTKWDLAPNPLSVALAERRAAGKPILDLTASNPTECGFHYDTSAILAALSNPASLTYEPDPRGLLQARQAVCEYYAARGDNVLPENVFLTTSTSEAYSYVFRLLCNPGDEVLVPQPSYPLFDFLAELQDVRLVRYPLVYDHGWQIDLHALRQAVTARTRAIIVVNPNNPTGHFCKRDEIAQLNQICAASGMAIIADEVFLDYAWEKNTARSFATNPQALTFTLSGISKISGLPQMKAAWLVTSGPHATQHEALARLEVIADTYLSMNAPIQHALPEFLRQRQAVQSQLKSRAAANLAELDRQLARHGELADDASHRSHPQSAGIRARLHLEGGWYTTLLLPANHSSEDFAMRLLRDHGIYVHPGHYYDFANDRAVVLSLLTSPPDFLAAVRTLLDAAIRNIAPPERI
jgi:alanine-synthesizing transaminase